MLPSIYDLGKFSRVFDYNEIVSREFKITKPTNIITQYYASPNVQILSNATYKIEASTSTFIIKLNNIEYTFPLTERSTILPLLLSEV